MHCMTDIPLFWREARGKMEEDGMWRMGSRLALDPRNCSSKHSSQPAIIHQPLFEVGVEIAPDNIRSSQLTSWLASCAPLDSLASDDDEGPEISG